MYGNPPASPPTSDPDPCNASNNNCSGGNGSGQGPGSGSTGPGGQPGQGSGGQQNGSGKQQQNHKKSKYWGCVGETAADAATGTAVVYTIGAVVIPTVGFALAGSDLGPGGTVAGGGLGLSIGLAIAPDAGSSGFLEGGIVGGTWGLIKCAF